MQEYENDRWRVVASKVGSGFTPAACKDKAQELEAIDRGEMPETAEEEGDDSGFTQGELGGSSSDPTGPYQ